MSRAPLLALAALAIPFGPAAGHASTPSLIVFSADRLPLFAGEVYRADPSGHRVDLSRSPSSDTQPLVSPDGKHVAFFSDRSGAIGVYEVRIGGTHLRNVGPASPQEEGDSLAWQPHGPRLAAITTDRAAVDTLWILRSGHKPRRVYSSRRGVLEPSWSPDGRVLLAWSGGAWRGFSPSDRRLWAHETPSGCCVRAGRPLGSSRSPQSRPWRSTTRAGTADSACPSGD